MHVAVLGAGYAGVTMARRLEDALRDDVEITLVDERETHLVQHLIHRLVRFPALSGSLTVAIEDILDRATHRRARVVDVDPDAGTVELEDESLSPDFLGVCLGARTAFYDMPGLEAHATPLKRPSHANQIRERFDEIRGTDARVVVGGAGLSGIQVAGELAEMAGENVEIRLLEKLDTVAPSFGPQFQSAVAEELHARGVRVETDRAVTGADEDGIALADGDRVPYDQFIWTGGIRGQTPLKGERPEVRATLRLGERTFVAGDAARVVDADGEPVPASAQSAMGQARVAASNLSALVSHHTDGSAGFEPRMETYRADEHVWLVSVGDAAVAQVGPVVIRGRAAEAIKTSVGAGYLGSVGAVEDATSFVRNAIGD